MWCPSRYLNLSTTTWSAASQRVNAPHLSSTSACRINLRRSSAEVEVEGVARVPLPRILDIPEIALRRIFRDFKDFRIPSSTVDSPGRQAQAGARGRKAEGLGA